MSTRESRIGQARQARRPGRELGHKRLRSCLSGHDVARTVCPASALEFLTLQNRPRQTQSAVSPPRRD